MEAPSSSAPSFPCAYQVFLSFRGKDTRTTFTDHLYTALTQAGIHTFRDDDEIERGEKIKQELKKAIQQSKVAVIVFSPDYAFSSWCLDELVLLNDRRKARLSLILPIFYHVDPCHVRWQTGSFGEAFARHENRYKEQPDKLEKWRSALKEVADLSGEILKDQHEARFIQNIVKLVGRKLDRKLLYAEPHLVGIYSYVNDINEWLEDESTDVRILIVHGIGGVGKTTIAKAVYNQNYDKFEKCSFLANVRETPVRRLQKQLLSDMGRSEKIYNTDQGVIKIKEATCFRKVLIVLDDLDDSEQLKPIIGYPKCLPLRSKFIITSRNMSLLNCHESFWNLNIKPLSDHDSFQLFNLHAFGRNHPPRHLFEYSKSAVRCCGGLPLALTVLASYLSSKTIDIWESAIKEIRAFPNAKVQKILKKSFDSLESDRPKHLFLHIACFFIGMNKNEVVTILDGCGFHTLIGIQHLIDRCLITINEDNEITMHQLVRDMGREIVRQESDEPGKRSRVWNHQEAFHVLTEKTGIETLKGLALDLPMLKEDKHIERISNDGNYISGNSLDGSMAAFEYNCLMLFSFGSFFWQLIMNMLFSLGNFFWQLIMNCFPSISSDVIKTEAFARICKLELLKLNNVKLEGGFEHFPKSLVWLCWRGFHLKYMPSSFYLKKLVVLDMSYSSLHRISLGTLPLPRLKILNLSNSYHLSTTPDFKVLPNMERLILKNCTKLAKIDESIGDLERLVLLNLNGCIKLRKLPRTIGRLKALQKLYLAGCTELRSFPKEMTYMEKLEVLVADGITFEELSTSWIHDREANQHSALGLVSRGGAKLSQFSLAFLPYSLTKLSLRYCNLSDDAFSGNLSLPILKILDLSGNIFHTLPDEIFEGFPSLYRLNLSKCHSLVALPHVPGSLGSFNLYGCRSITKLPNFGSLLGFTFDVLEEEDIAMIHRLKLFDEQNMLNLELEMYSTAARMRITTPVKALREHGIFSIYQPGSEIPSWYRFQKDGSSISFILEDEIIYTLNICIVYEVLKDSFSYDPLYLTVRSRTRLSYTPAFFARGVRRGGGGGGGDGPSEACNDMLWLSSWNIYNVLNGGDEVKVKVGDFFGHIEVKRIGVHAVEQREWDDCPSTLRSLLPSPLSQNTGFKSTMILNY